LLTLQGFNENCWRPLKAFTLKILDNVFNNKGGAGIAASSHRGLPCRGLKFQTCTNVLINFFVTIPGIFGSSLFSRPSHCSYIRIPQRVPRKLFVFERMHYSSYRGKLVYVINITGFESECRCSFKIP